MKDAAFAVAVAAIGFPMFMASAAAQSAAASYPSKPIRLIVPLAAGGPSDTMARTLAQKLGEVTRQNVIVDNRPGASGIIGTELVAKSPPDGYTVLLVSTAISINPSLFAKLPYDTLKDLTGVSLLAGAPYILAVHPSLPVKNVKQLIALAKARPGELNYSAGGGGSTGGSFGNVVATTTQAAGAAVRPVSEVDVMATLERKSAAAGDKLNWKTSIVDLLKLLDLDSSLASRKELADELGAPADLKDGSAEMNLWLHREVLRRIAANGGNIPASMLD